MNEKKDNDMPGILAGLAILIVCVGIVSIAIYELSQSRFWDAAPVLLKRALER